MKKKNKQKYSSVRQYFSSTTKIHIANLFCENFNNT